jgi:hypothetical protein
MSFIFALGINNILIGRFTYFRLMYKYLLLAGLFCISYSIKADISLKSLISQLDTATSSDTFERLAKESEQIVSLQENDWLAYYWSSFCYAAAANLAPRGSRDPFLDNAQSKLDKSASIKNDEAEILLLQSWIYSLRITVAPGSRMKEFGTKSKITRESAYAIDPQNPRYYFLKATSLYFSPPFIGGGKSKAKPFFEESIRKFDLYKSKGDLYPKWGIKQANALLGTCD